MPRFVQITTIVMCVIAALLGLRVGWVYATLTESDVIEAAVADYIDFETGFGNSPAETDCSARPGSGRAWIVVLCTPQADSNTGRTEYYITRFGRMERYRGG